MDTNSLQRVEMDGFVGVKPCLRTSYKSRIPWLAMGLGECLEAYDCFFRATGIQTPHSAIPTPKYPVTPSESYKIGLMIFILRPKVASDFNEISLGIQVFLQKSGGLDLTTPPTRRSDLALGAGSDSAGSSL